MNQPADSPEEVEATYRTIARRLIPFLGVCYLLAYIDRSNIGIAKLELSKQIGLTEAAYGLGGGLFYLTYSLLEIPSNLLLARVGARLTLARVMFLWSLVSAATAFISNTTQFYVVRLLLGAAEAGFFPGVLYYLRLWAPAERRARLTGFFMAAMALAGVISNPLSGTVMVAMEGSGGLKGWQWLFLVEGIPGCFLAIAAAYILTDEPAMARWLSPRQKAIVARDLQREAVRAQGSGHARLLDALKDIRFVALSVMAMAMLSGLAGLGLWLPTIVHRSGVKDVVLVGLLSSLPYVFGIVAQQLIARSSDRLRERRWHAAAPGLFGAVAWLILPTVANVPSLALAALTCVGIGMFGATGPFWSMPSHYLKGTAAAGGIALITTLGSLSAFFSPILVGWFSERTGSLAFGQYYFGALLMIGALLLLIAPRDGSAARSTNPTSAAISQEL